MRRFMGPTCTEKGKGAEESSPGERKKKSQVEREKDPAYRNAPRRCFVTRLQPADAFARGIDSSVPKHNRAVDRGGHDHVGRVRSVGRSVEHRRTTRIGYSRRRRGSRPAGGLRLLLLLLLAQLSSRKRVLLTGILRRRCSVLVALVCIRVVEQRVERALGIRVVIVCVSLCPSVALRAI